MLQATFKKLRATKAVAIKAATVHAIDLEAAKLGASKNMEVEQIKIFVLIAEAEKKDEVLIK